jgi:hypothetical protein
MARLSALVRSEHFIVPAALTLLAALASFPLVTQFSTHIAGVEGDVWSYLWAMGWARVAALNLATNPFHTDYVFYPLGGATQLLWGTALPSFASIPLQLAFGLVPAFNLVYLAASVLTGYGMYLLAKYEFRFLNFKFRNLNFAAFIAGLAFTFSALRLGYGLAFTNLFHTEFIPFYVLFLLKTTRAPGWKNAVMAGLFFGLNAYVDFQIAAFLALLTVLWFLFLGARMLFQKSRSVLHLRAKNGSNPLLRALVLIAVAGVVVLPMLGLVLNDFAIEGGNYIRVFPLRYSAERSYDALAYALPNARSTLYQNVPAPRVENVNASVRTPDESELSPDRQSFLGITLLALAVVGAIRFGRKLLFWILVTLLFAVLSLGPVLHLAGINTNIPLPFALMNPVPILNNIRIPMRYGLMVFFGASLLAGAGAFVLVRWRAWLFVPIVALLLAETMVLPYPTLEFRVPRIYEQIAQSADDVSVLEIPSFNWRHAAQNEAYQAIHHKRILRAYTNRIAPDLAEYFNLRQTPIVVRSLRILEGAEQGILTDEEIAQDTSVLEDTLAFFNLRYAVLHRNQLPAERVTQLDQYLRETLHARVIDDADGVIAYELPQTDFTAQARALDLASNATLMYLGRGWQTEPLANVEGSQGRYANAARAEVYIPQTNAAQMALDLYSAANEATLQTQINDGAAQPILLRQGWETYPLAVTWSERLNRLHLFFDSNVANRFAIGALESR